MAVESGGGGAAKPTINVPGPVGGSSGPLPANRSGKSGFGGPMPGEDTRQQYVPHRMFWTDSNGNVFSIAQANEMLVGLGYAWQIPNDIVSGSAEHARIKNQLDLVYGRWQRGDAALNPAYDFDLYGEGMGYGDYGLGEYSDWVEAGRPGAGGGGFGGGRGGAMGPVYVDPDAGAVEEYVKSYVVATTGTLHQDILDGATQVWLDASRKNFDNPEQEIDATTAMKEYVRGTDIYKHVHQIRPESVDEMQWVTGRQAQLRQLGLNAELAERVGVDLSEAGAAAPAVQRGGEMAQAGATGRLLASQRERLKSKAVSALGLV